MNAISPFRPERPAQRYGVPTGSVLEIGFTISAAQASLPGQEMVEGVHSALRPFMKSEAFCRSNYDGILEDWGLSTWANSGPGQTHAWFYFALDRLMSPRFAEQVSGELRDALYAHKRLPEGIDISIMASDVRFSPDLSDGALADARLRVADRIFEGHLLSSGVPSRPLSAGWAYPGQADALRRPVTVNGSVVPATFSVEFRRHSSAIAAVSLFSMSGEEIAITSPLHDSSFKATINGNDEVEIGWKDMLHRVILLAGAQQDKTEAEISALDAVSSISITLGSTLDKGFWGVAELSPQIDSATLQSYGDLSPLGEQVRQVIAMAEGNLADGGALYQLAPTAIANLWAAHGTQVEAVFRQSLAINPPEQSPSL